MALSHLVVQYESNFCTVALQFMEEEKNYPLPSPATTGTATRGAALRWSPWGSLAQGSLVRAVSRPLVLLGPEPTCQVGATQISAVPIFPEE